MPRMGFELTTPLLEPANTVHALDATVIGKVLFIIIIYLTATGF
jgi:hypothetical protein